MSIADIATQVNGYGIKHIVITGGEPMLFDGTTQLANKCRENGMTITIETAGTIYRDLPCDLMSISPKLANSTPDGDWQQRHDQTRLNLSVLQRLIDGYPYQLKFVVGENIAEDVKEIEALLAQLNGVDPSRVLLMPEGTDSATLHRRAHDLVSVVMGRNWRLTTRLHIDLFGNTKGT